MTKNKFVAQSASESEDEKSIEKKVFDSSEEEEIDEEMTKEDLEFLKEEEDDENTENESESSGEESPEELSDEDLDLIEENLGKRRSFGGPSASQDKGKGKFKRLRRRNEIESSEEEADFDNEEEESSKGTKKKTSELQNLFNEEEESEEQSEEDDDLKDFIEEDQFDESEDELPETIADAMKRKERRGTATGVPRRRAIIDDREAPKRALTSALASGQISKQAWDEMMEIFGDGTDYLDLVVESDDEDKPTTSESLKSVESENLERMAALEVSSKDIPERFTDLNIQIVDNDPEFEAFLQKESIFIAKKIQKTNPTDSFSGLASATLSVLRFIHHHGLEIPFIATYRREYIKTFLELNELWTVIDEDFKYRQAYQLKKRIKEKLIDIEGQLSKSDLEYINEALENEWEEPQLQFIQEFLIKERRKSPSKQQQKSAILLDFAHKIVPSASNFAENSRKRRILHGPLILSEVDMESEAVEVIARDAASNLETALSGAVNVLAEEYGNNPQLFAEIRDSLLNQAVVTVTPTALGSIEISHDPTHYLLTMQYVTAKPISTFVEDQGLAISRGLDAKLITVDIDYRGKNEIFQDIQQYLPGLESFKREVFDLAWNNYWCPRLNRLILQRLRNEAESWIAHFSQFYLQELLMTAPLNCSSLENDEIAVTSVNFVNEVLNVAELDKHGRVLRMEALPTKMSTKPEATLNKFISRSCPYVVVSGEGQDCLELYRDLRANSRSTVMWGCDDTDRIYSNSMRAARELPECSPELKRAVAAGRRLLDPVVEFAMLTEDELLRIPLHPLQAHLPRALRLKYLQRALVNVINLLGVSINELILPGSKQAVLSYVSGLGPQKSAQLIKKLGSKWLNSRAELITQYEMGRLTFTNCAGFIKITSERSRKSSGKKKNYSNETSLLEPLDGTRIHPESYELARRLAADVLEMENSSSAQRHPDIFGDNDDAQDSSNLTNAVIQIMREPKKLDDLMIDEYAREIEKLKNLPKHVTLEHIVVELADPFPDPRSNESKKESKLSVNSFVRMLTGRDEYWWYIGRPVSVKLLNPPARKLASLIDANGLTIKIEDELPRNVRPGARLNAFLSKIDLRRLIVDVTLRKNENLDYMKTVGFDGFYDFGRVNSIKSQQNQASQDSQMARGNAASNSRQLSHPAFKPLNREDAENFLALAPVGEFIIRPSSQKRVGGDLPGDLTLTWKVGHNLFSHVPLGETDRPNGQDWLLGRTLLLPALIPGPDGRMKIDKFEDLDEIVGRRIEPIVSLLQEAQACPKYFANPSKDAIFTHLKDQTALNPGRTPYCITLATEPHCGHLILSHPGGSRQELIRVDPRGYALTDPKLNNVHIFERIEKLVDYFKRNYKNFSEKKVTEGSSNSKDSKDSVSKSTSTTTSREDPRANKYQQFAN